MAEVHQPTRKQKTLQKPSIYKLFLNVKFWLHHLQCTISKYSQNLETFLWKGPKALLHKTDIILLFEIDAWSQKSLSMNTVHYTIHKCRLKLYNAKKSRTWSGNIVKFCWPKSILNKLWLFVWPQSVFCQTVVEILNSFGKHGRLVLWTKEDRDHPTCYDYYSTERKFEWF